MEVRNEWQHRLILLEGKCLKKAPMLLEEGGLNAVKNKLLNLAYENNQDFFDDMQHIVQTQKPLVIFVDSIKF